jgi:hypothetical protein
LLSEKFKTIEVFLFIIPIIQVILVIPAHNFEYQQERLDWASLILYLNMLVNLIALVLVISKYSFKLEHKIAKFEEIKSVKFY